MNTIRPSQRTTDGADVMAAIDQSGEDELFIISDVSRDDAWLTIPATEAVALHTRI